MDGTGETHSSAHASPASWLSRLDRHAEEHGFHVRLAGRHGALFTEDGDTLLVTFESGETIRESETALPFGLTVAGREGWSQLALYSEGDTWFRDPEVFAFVDDLVDDGFFDHFDRVLFYGAGMGGYAAAAFSVAAPGATVVTVRPLATLDPRVAGWDRRHLRARRHDFSSRYGYAPSMAEAAGALFVLYDPQQREDAMHAALFTRAGAAMLRCPHLGRRTEEHLEGMGLLVPLLLAAGRGRLDPARFARLWRKRRRHAAYLRHVMGWLGSEDRPWLQGLWCRAALREVDRPALRRGLEEAEAALALQHRSLPPPRPAD